jgi:hypothetical protein
VFAGFGSLLTRGAKGAVEKRTTRWEAKGVLKPCDDGDALERGDGCANATFALSGVAGISL